MPIQPLIGEIRFWANPMDMPDDHWLLCDGRELSAETGGQFTALFLAIGHTYGGQGKKFRLPDLRQRTAIGAGQGVGLSPRAVGASGGHSTVAQTDDNMPEHIHVVDYADVTGVATHVAEIPSIFSIPQPDGFLAHGRFTRGFSGASAPIYRSSPRPESIVPTGGTWGTMEGDLKPAGRSGPEPRQNRQPFLTQGFYIAFRGVEPRRRK